MPIVRKLPPPRIPDPIPQKLTREQAIERLLAHGLSLAEIQAEEEQIAAMHAVALLRARYWTARSTAVPAASPPPPPPSPVPTPAPATLRYRVRNWKDYNRALI